MANIIEELSQSEAGKTTFKFTESDATISFEKLGAGVRITCTYAPGQIKVPFAAFGDAVRTSNSRLRHDLVARYPRLGGSAAFEKLLPRSKYE
jgi:hypothetical protein